MNNERMTGGFVDTLIASARDNPVAAALIGGGALWLLIGNSTLKGAAATATSAVMPAVDTATRALRSAASTVQTTVAPPTAPDMVEGIGAGISEAARSTRDAMASAGQGLLETGQNAMDRLGQGMSGAGDAVGSTIARTQSSLAELMERQPLVLGAVGLAIGAALASTFRTSDVEKAWIGELGEGVRQGLAERAEAVTAVMQQGSGRLMAEVRQAGSEAGSQLQRSGEDALKSARDALGAGPPAGSHKGGGSPIS